MLAASACAPGASGNPRQPAITLSACTLPNLDRPAQCGELEVFENRAAAAGRTIRLRVAVIPAGGPDTLPDPVFVLVGGPGQSAVDNAAVYARLLAPLRINRALVFVDQRGTGASNPLGCDLYSGQPAGALGDFMPLDAVRSCRDSLATRADLRFYSTETAVDDLDDVRRALGYDQINLEAASYGTRVGLLYLKRHGAHVRSAVLRSVSPPWTRQPLHFALDSQAAFDSLVAACDAESACRKAFPRVRAELDSVLARLEREPATVEMPAADSGAPKRRVQLGRGPFAEKVRFMLYDPGLSQFLPVLIHHAYAGDFAPFVELAADIGRQISRVVSNGMYLSVTCVEDVNLISPAEAATNGAGTFLRNYRVEQQRAACELWPKGQVDSNYTARVKSDAPVLLVSSTTDPVTPPHGAAEAAEGLSRSTQLLVPSGPHSPATRCLMGIVTEFIKAASASALDTACLSESRRPPFALALP